MNDLLQKIQSQLSANQLSPNLTPLFCQTLNWGAPRGLTPRPLQLGAPINTTLTAVPVAQLSGLPVYRVDWPDDRLPGVTARRAVQRALAPVHAEHLLCYLSRDRRQAAFTWARKRPDGRTELRTLPYEAGSPARTTIERLGELAFRLDELGPTGQPPITAVTDKLSQAFSVEAVTRRFYQEIANWYFWAREQVEFPMPKTEKNADAYVAQSLIRLITRLIFCWFVRQMGLIPGELFDPQFLPGLLKDGANLPDSHKTTFYKAILQNLFFATLNQEMDRRGFRKRNKDPQGRDPHRGITNLYRYEDCFTDPNAFLELMRGIPFLNGGLFECLDKVYRAEEKLPDVRIDGFSDHPKNPLSVPDFLFFGNERTVDLSKAYGEAKYKRAAVRGLIHIFRSYNFTITEATPLDQEVALDPELSGKVFENLLAAYNPETATTARKQTGSFYTPREIVDYMVDEALIAYLKTKVEQTILSAPSGADNGGADNPVREEQQAGLPALRGGADNGGADNPVRGNEQAGLPALQGGAGNPACGQEQTRLSALRPFTAFNPEAEVHRTHRRLPHWTQEGRTYFVTFRLADSLPQDKLRQWAEERTIWLEHHPEPWSDRDWAEYNERFGQRLEAWLDAGEGECHLRRPEIRALVESCLRHFDGQRYDLFACVVMPNHVHLLLRPREGFALADILQGIKGVSAREANKRLGRIGTFWQEESFDHIVRSQAQFEHFLHYIADNPTKARLSSGEYALFQRGADNSGEQTRLSALQGGADNPVREDQQTGLSALQGGADNPVREELEQRLRHLFAYTDEPHPFSPAEVETLIAAIDNLKALDPACGSGAFPMGLLHKLVFILGKLDPHNEQWKQKQIAKAGEIPDATIREKTLADIEQAFAANELDYGRKLYLIENCIYGVDIQPIAVQIAKMRFFISLTVDQKADPTKENLGIRPLPNLETKFVAANTLIGIERPAQQMLRNPQIDAREAELRQVRERHFTARTPATKAKCRELDAKLRAEISELLRADGFARETTEKLANWDPYDQNASADFFDPEWMFGIRVGQAFLPVTQQEAQTGMSAPPSGFDIVIGNPPYVRIQTLAATEPAAVEYYKSRYASASKGNYDLYVVFVERSLQLLQPAGQLAYILPHKFFNAQYGEPLRKLLAGGRHLRHVVHFGDQQIFPGATNYVCLLFLAKAGSDACRFVRVENLPDWLATLQGTEGAIPATGVTDAEWNFAVGRSAGLCEKLQGMPVKLGDVAEIFVGLQTSADDVFIMNFVSETARTLTLQSKYLENNWTFEKGLLHPIVSGTDVSPFSPLPNRQFILFPYRIQNEHAELIPLREIADTWPHTAEYLKATRQRLEDRESGKLKGQAKWHGYIYLKNMTRQETPKVCVPRLVEYLHAAADFEGEYFLDNVDVGGVTFRDNDDKHSLAYLLALLNSRLLRWYFPHVSAPFRGGFRSANKQFLSLVPFRPINFTDGAERAEHDALVKLVERVLAAKRADPAADTSALEREIDERVYRLYGLTPEEIKIVEESTRR